MEQWAWILWVVLGVVFIIAEIFTLGFVLLWFGIGAIAAALQIKTYLPYLHPLQ
jgi:membrane protein implicated in regulation of membrane protease activity